MRGLGPEQHPGVEADRVRQKSPRPYVVARDHTKSCQSISLGECTAEIAKHSQRVEGGRAPAPIPLDSLYELASLLERPLEHHTCLHPRLNRLTQRLQESFSPTGRSDCV